MFSQIQQIRYMNNGETWLGSDSMFCILDSEKKLSLTRMLKDNIVKFIDTKNGQWVIYSRGASRCFKSEWTHYEIRPTVLDIAWSEDKFWILRRNTKHVFFLEEFDQNWNYIRTLDAQPDERVNPAWGTLFYHKRWQQLFLVPRNDSKIHCYPLGKAVGWKRAEKGKKKVEQQLINIAIPGMISHAVLKSNILWLKCGDYCLSYNLGNKKWSQRKFEGDWHICAPISSEKEEVIVSYTKNSLDLDKESEPTLWYPEKNKEVKATTTFLALTGPYYLDTKHQLYQFA